MIEFRRIDIYGFKTAARGARNAMNSWDKGDSDVVDKDGLGPNDFALLKKLSKAGPDHGKALRMIDITMDITAPLYWWKEMDTYKVGTAANSCSTMHKIHAKEFAREDFSIEHLKEPALRCLDNTIYILNAYRRSFLETKNKEDWWQMIQLLPSSYNQKRTWHANYAVLRNIYHARKDHKLDEWHDFCDLVKTFPYSELITELE